MGSRSMLHSTLINFTSAGRCHRFVSRRWRWIISHAHSFFLSIVSSSLFTMKLVNFQTWPTLCKSCHQESDFLLRKWLLWHRSFYFLPKCPLCHSTGAISWRKWVKWDKLDIFRPWSFKSRWERHERPINALQVRSSVEQASLRRLASKVHR